MTVINVAPHVFKNYKLRIDVDNYEAAVSSFAFTPSSSISTWKGGTPASVHSDSSTATWVADLTVAQDWTTTGSLAAYLLANAGEEVTVEFFPLGVGPSFTATIVLVAPAIGGAIDAWGASTVQCPVRGAPVLVPAVAAV